MTDANYTSALHPSQYAGFWIRFFAACIDMIVYMPVYAGMKYAFNMAMGPTAAAAGAAEGGSEMLEYIGAQSTTMGPYHWWFEGAFVVFALVSYAWLFSSKWQGSPGMHILKFHVCDVHGNRLTFARALVWGLYGMIGWAFCFAGVLYMQNHFDLRALHDLMRSCEEQNLTLEDCRSEVEKLINIPYESYIMISFASMGLAFFLSLIWALSIALPKDKTGFNNLVCGTRFIKGRPPVGGHEPMPVVE